MVDELGETTVPDKGIETIEAQLCQLINGGLHPAAIPQHRNVVGE